MFTNLELQAMEGKHLQLIPRTLARCEFIKFISQEFTQLLNYILQFVTQRYPDRKAFVFFHLRLDTAKSDAIGGP